MWCRNLQLSLALHLMHHMALNHRDKNITAAYLRVRPRPGALPLFPHLHFVARAKVCHLKSHTDLPPYGHSPQKVARELHGHHLLRWGEGCVFSVPPPPHPPSHTCTHLHSSKSFICPMDRPPPPNSSSCHQPLCPLK